MLATKNRRSPYWCAWQPRSASCRQLCKERTGNMRSLPACGCFKCGGPLPAVAQRAVR